MMKEYDYWLWSIEGIGSSSIYKLKEKNLRAKDLYYLRPEQIDRLEILKDGQKKALIQAKKRNPQKEFERLKERGIHFTVKGDKEYPQELLGLSDAPYGLFYYGSLPAKEPLKIAIVGARECSNYGKSMALEIAKELSNAGILVISGMARGIDGYAHRGALTGESPSYAVLGCGVDVCYPLENRDLYDEMKERGGIISEYPPGTVALAKHFPMRNRIISGMADAVLVIEAKEKSGSLITVDFALEQGREIFALPGPADSRLSLGCHNLIRQGAGIYTNVEQLLKDLFVLRIYHTNIMEKEWNFADSFANSEEKPLESEENLHLEKEERIVYSEIALRPKSPEEVAKTSLLSVAKVRGILVALNMKGYIEEVGKNRYVRK